MIGGGRTTQKQVPQRGIAFEILAHLGGAVMDFVGGTIDVFGSLPDIVVDSRNLGLAHPVRPHHPRAKPLRMMDQDMKRRPFDGNARSLEPDAQPAKILSMKRSSRVSFVNQCTTSQSERAVTGSIFGGAFISCS
jgi:hypothetical protein